MFADQTDGSRDLRNSPYVLFDLAHIDSGGLMSFGLHETFPNDPLLPCLPSFYDAGSDNSGAGSDAAAGHLSLRWMRRRADRREAGPTALDADR